MCVFRIGQVKQGRGGESGGGGGVIVIVV